MRRIALVVVFAVMAVGGLFAEEKVLKFTKSFAGEIAPREYAVYYDTDMLNRYMEIVNSRSWWHNDVRVQPEFPLQEEHLQYLNNYAKFIIEQVVHLEDTSYSVTTEYYKLAGCWMTVTTLPYKASERLVALRRAAIIKEEK